MFVDDQSLNAKELLYEYQEIMKSKADQAKSLKNGDDYLKWYEENQDDIHKVLAIRSEILFLFENDTAKFTVDEETYELAQNFLEDFIKEIDYLIKVHDSEPLLINASEYNPDDNNVFDDFDDFEEPKDNKPVSFKINGDTLKQLKSTYEGYLEKLKDSLPKC